MGSVATTTAVIPMSAEAEASPQLCSRTDHDGSLEAAVVGGKNEGLGDRFDVVRRYLIIKPRGNPPAHPRRRLNGRPKQSHFRLCAHKKLPIVLNSVHTECSRRRREETRCRATASHL
jgi:hypothetical protein